MTDSDFNGYEPDPLDEIFAEYKPALGTKPLLDTKSLEAIYRQPVLPAMLLSSSRNGWRAAAGPGLILLWVAMLFSLVWLDARYHASTRHTSAFAAQPVAFLVQARDQDYASAPVIEPQDFIGATGKSVPEQQDALEQPVAATPGPLTFRVSKFEYPDNTNLDTAVAHDPALGEGWRPADWDDLVRYNSSHPIRELINSLNWTEFGSDTAGNYLLRARDQFWLRYDGRSKTCSTEQHWEVITNAENSHRHYFVALMDGHVPKTFKVFANIENNEIVLGSWYDWKFPVLAVRKETPR